MTASKRWWCGALAARGLGPDPAAVAAFRADYARQHAAEQTRPYPGTAETLQRTAAAEGWRLGVCTNKPRGSAARTILRTLGLEDLLVQRHGRRRPAQTGPGAYAERGRRSVAGRRIVGGRPRATTATTSWPRAQVRACRRSSPAWGYGPAAMAEGAAAASQLRVSAGRPSTSGPPTTVALGRATRVTPPEMRDQSGTSRVLKNKLADTYIFTSDRPLGGCLLGFGPKNSALQGLRLFRQAAVRRVQQERVQPAIVLDRADAIGRQAQPHRRSQHVRQQRRLLQVGRKRRRLLLLAWLTLLPASTPLPEIMQRRDIVRIPRRLAQKSAGYDELLPPGQANLKSAE